MIIPYTTGDGKTYAAADGAFLVLEALVLVTDRTAQDFARWRELRDKGWANMTAAEREEWLSDEMTPARKGSYGATDLNRVGSALNYVRDSLTAAGYLGGSEFDARTDFSRGEIPDAEYLSYYLRAVAIVREALAQWRTTPYTPADVGSLDYLDANAIEQILVDVDQLITNMLAARHFCGGLYSGEV